MDIIAQGVGFVALIISVFSLQMNNREKVIFVQMMGSIFWIIHFMLLGALTGAMLNLINIIRNIVFYKKKDQKWAQNVWWLYGMIIAFVAATVLTWEGAKSVLPGVGVVLSAIIFWQSEVKYIRWGSLIVSALWFTYNYISGSYMGMANELLVTISNVIAIVRFDIIGRKASDIK